MAVSAHRMRYQDNINRVLNYIEKHLDETLDLAKLSDVACFSKFHFHRQFALYTGVNLHKYLQLQRLKRASYRLVFAPQTAIIDIALEAGFSSAESFSRAFKKHFSQTPSAFRVSPQWPLWHQKYQYKIDRGVSEMQVNIVEIPQIPIAVFEHRGAVSGLNYSIEKFIKWRKRTQLSPIASSGTFGLAYDDPANTAADEFRFDICGEVSSPVPENQEGVVSKVIPQGRCAKILHHGSHDLMDEKIYYLYANWLPESSFELRDFPCFFKYLNFFPEVSEHELLTEIYLPIK